jgi:hypothetical protein
LNTPTPSPRLRSKRRTPCLPACMLPTSIKAGETGPSRDASSASFRGSSYGWPFRSCPSSSIYLSSWPRSKPGPNERNSTQPPCLYWHHRSSPSHCQPSCRTWRYHRNTISHFFPSNRKPSLWHRHFSPCAACRLGLFSHQQRPFCRSTRIWFSRRERHSAAFHLVPQFEPSQRG